MFISFAFGKGVAVVDWLENMKLYVSNTEESYKDTIIDHMGNSGTADLLLHIVQCWCVCKVDEEKRALFVVLFCSDVMYIVSPNKTQRGRKRYSH